MATESSDIRRLRQQVTRELAQLPVRPWRRKLTRRQRLRRKLDAAWRVLRD